MTITVDTPATSYDLTTLADVQLILNLLDSSDSHLLSKLITRASAACAAYCKRTFAKEVVTEVIPGTGTPRMVLERFPIVSIDAVTYDGTAVDSGDYSIERHERGWVLMEDGWTLTNYSNDIPKPDWTIQYTAGFVLPSHSGTRDLPYDVEEACLEAVKSWYYARCRDGTLRTEEVVDVWQGSYSGNALPLKSRQLLDPWRVFWV